MIAISDMLNVANAAAIAAGKAIMRIYTSGDFNVEQKKDHSPVTLADKAAHQIISTQLATTGIPMLSEEGRDIPYDIRKSWEYFWLVDPLDGTKEFINQNDEFTVNIALIHDQRPIAGVIYAPSQDLLYHGSCITGVYKTQGNSQQQLSAAINKASIEKMKAKHSVTIVASKSHMNKETTQFIAQFDRPELKSMGSSFKLMLIAESAADIYPRLAPTMEWDIAAGHALLNALNKGVYQTDLKTELLYNKPSLLNPGFIAM